MLLMTPDPTPACRGILNAGDELGVWSGVICGMTGAGITSRCGGVVGLWAARLVAVLRPCSRGSGERCCGSAGVTGTDSGSDMLTAQSIALANVSQASAAAAALAVGIPIDSMDWTQDAPVLGEGRSSLECRGPVEVEVRLVLAGARSMASAF